MKKLLMLAIMLLSAPLLLTACGTSTQKTANVDALTTHTRELTNTLSNPMDDSNYETAITASAEFTNEALKSSDNPEVVHESVHKIQTILIKAHKEKRKLHEDTETKKIVEYMKKIIQTTNTKKIDIIYKKSHLESLVDSLGNN